MTPFENGHHLPASGGSTPQRNQKQRKPRAEVTSREVTCQTDMTRYEMERLESGQAQKVTFEIIFSLNFLDCYRVIDIILFLILGIKSKLSSQ